MTPAALSHPQLPSVQRVVDLGVCTWIRKNTDGQPCGLIHNRCAGHLKSTNPDRADTRDYPCGQPPQKGLTVCRFHGGGAPHVRAFAARNAALDRAKGEMGELLDACRTTVAGRTTVDALDEMRERAGAMVVALGLLVGGLATRADAHIDWVTGDGASHLDVTVHTEGIVGPDHAGDLKAHPYEQLYGQWLDRAARIEKLAADLGLEERRITLDESRAQAIIVVIRGTLEALGIDFDDGRVPGIVAGQLRALEAGGP